MHSHYRPSQQWNWISCNFSQDDINFTKLLINVGACMMMGKFIDAMGIRTWPMWHLTMHWWQGMHSFKEKSPLIMAHMDLLFKNISNRDIFSYHIKYIFEWKDHANRDHGTSILSHNCILVFHKMVSFLQRQNCCLSNRKVSRFLSKRVLELLVRRYGTKRSTWSIEYSKQRVHLNLKKILKKSKPNPGKADKRTKLWY